MMINMIQPQTLIDAQHSHRDKTATSRVLSPAPPQMEMEMEMEPTSHMDTAAAAAASKLRSRTQSRSLPNSPLLAHRSITSTSATASGSPLIKALALPISPQRSTPPPPTTYIPPISLSSVSTSPSPAPTEEKEVKSETPVKSLINWGRTKSREDASLPTPIPKADDGRRAVEEVTARRREEAERKKQEDAIKKEEARKRKEEKRLADEAKRKIEDEKRKIEEKLRAEEDNFAKKVAKSRIYIKMFALPKGEQLIDDFSCALQSTILLHGRMYVSQNYVCFYSNILFTKTQLVIPVTDIIRAEPANIALVIPNSIRLHTRDGKIYFFASFLTRDDALKLIQSVMPQQPQEEEKKKEEENKSDSESTPATSTSNASTTSTTTVSSTSSSASTSTSPSTPALPPLPESLDFGQHRPHFSHDGLTYDTLLTTSISGCDVHGLFHTFWRDHAIYPWSQYHLDRGDTDVAISSWSPTNDNMYTRDLSMRVAVSGPIGPNSSRLHVVQRYKWTEKDTLLIECSSQTPDVPFGDCFQLLVRITMSSIPHLESSHPLHISQSARTSPTDNIMTSSMTRSHSMDQGMQRPNSTTSRIRSASDDLADVTSPASVERQIQSSQSAILTPTSSLALPTPLSLTHHSHSDPSLPHIHSTSITIQASIAYVRSPWGLGAMKSTIRTRALADLTKSYQAWIDKCASYVKEHPDQVKKETREEKKVQQNGITTTETITQQVQVAPVTTTPATAPTAASTPSSLLSSYIDRIEYIIQPLREHPATPIVMRIMLSLTALLLVGVLSSTTTTTHTLFTSSLQLFALSPQRLVFLILFSFLTLLCLILRSHLLSVYAHVEQLTELTQQQQELMTSLIQQVEKLQSQAATQVISVNQEPT